MVKIVHNFLERRKRLILLQVEVKIVRKGMLDGDITIVFPRLEREAKSLESGLKGFNSHDYSLSFHLRQAILFALRLRSVNVVLRPCVVAARPAPRAFKFSAIFGMRLLLLPMMLVSYPNIGGSQIELFSSRVMLVENFKRYPGLILTALGIRQFQHIGKESFPILVGKQDEIPEIESRCQDVPIERNLVLEVESHHSGTGSSSTLMVRRSGCFTPISCTASVASTASLARSIASRIDVVTSVSIASPAALSSNAVAASLSEG